MQLHGSKFTVWSILTVLYCVIKFKNNLYHSFYYASVRKWRGSTVVHTLAYNSTVTNRAEAPEVQSIDEFQVHSSTVCFIKTRTIVKTRVSRTGVCHHQFYFNKQHVSYYPLGILEITLRISRENKQRYVCRRVTT